MKTSIVKNGKELLNNIGEIDDLIDNFFEPIKDYTDTVGDILLPIKAIISLNNLNKKRKFNSFLKSFSKYTEGKNLNIGNETENLKKYLKNKKNFNFLNEIIENAINSKSIYGSILLGHYASLILSKEKKLGFPDFIIIEGLKQLNDIEFACYARIFEHGDRSKMIYFAKLDGLDGIKSMCEFTIDKLIYLRIVEKDPNTYYDSNRNYNFISTDISEGIYNLISASGIYEELLKYEID